MKNLLSDTLRAALIEVFATHPDAKKAYSTINEQIFLTRSQAESHAGSLLDKTVEKHLAADFEEKENPGTEGEGAEGEGAEGVKVPFDSSAPLAGLSGASIAKAVVEADEKAELTALRAEYKELHGKAALGFMKADALKTAIAEKKVELTNQ
jgi:hypothetical protein